MSTTGIDKKWILIGLPYTSYLKLMALLTPLRAFTGFILTTKGSDMNIGYRLQNSPDKGEGIFSTKQFDTSDIVMNGVIEKYVESNHSHASQIGEFKYALHGGLSSKINHSCNPNCGIRLNKSGAHDYIARRLIEIDEEITFDYAMRNYSIEYFPAVCCCGSLNCRGSITGWKDLPDNFKRDYKGFVAPYLLEIDAKKLSAQIV